MHRVLGRRARTDQYLVGWTRDFITVLAPSAAAPASTPPDTSRLRP